MSERQHITLGEVANIQTGPFGSQLHSSDYVEIGIPSIMPTNIGSRLEINRNNIACISQIDAQRLDKYLVQDGDIVYSRRGDVEKCAYITKNESGWLCGTGCLRVRFISDEVSQKFCAYYLSTEEMRGWVSGHAVGTTMPNLNSSILRRLPLLLPSLPEQKAIAAVLSSLDDKIDLLHRQNQTLEALAETLFRQWFVVEAQEGWEEKKLKDVVDIAIGRTPPRQQYQWFSTSSNDVKWISIKDLGNDGAYIFQTSEYLTQAAIEQFNIPVIPENTVVLSFKMTVGRVAITTSTMLSNEAIAHFKFNSKTPFTQEYLYLFLKNYKYDLLGSTSSIVTSINSAMIKEMEIIIPDNITMKKFEIISKSFFKKIRENQSQIRTLETLRDTLLPKLMSGEVRVRFDEETA
ncbi:restriction endonuclease subunit S [Methyloglobulus sp.]|uniref:restriction endonuclease subunit S n=1 Tax=Methyloglobulus sp. TaxID=2518622 RepID=UPI0032B79048